MACSNLAVKRKRFAAQVQDEVVKLGKSLVTSCATRTVLNFQLFLIFCFQQGHNGKLSRKF
jgi:hypothetical protein